MPRRNADNNKKIGAKTKLSLVFNFVYVLDCFHISTRFVRDRGKKFMSARKYFEACPTSLKRKIFFLFLAMRQEFTTKQKKEEKRKKSFNAVTLM